MADPKPITDDLDFSTNRIGEQTRTVSVGVLAIAWLFLAGGSSAPTVKSAPSVDVLLLTCGLAIGSLLADYFQYLAAYFSSREVLENILRDANAKAEYDKTKLSYRARGFFFVVKQLACLAATLVLVCASLRAVLGA